MVDFLVDFGIFTVLIVVLSAFSASIVSVIGRKVLGRKTENIFVNASDKITANWRGIGGDQK